MAARRPNEEIRAPAKESQRAPRAPAPGPRQGAGKASDIPPDRRLDYEKFRGFQAPCDQCGNWPGWGRADNPLRPDCPGGHRLSDMRQARRGGYAVSG